MPTGNSVNAFNSLEMCACALPSLHSLVEMDIHSCQCTLSFTLRHTHARVYGTTSLATVHVHEPMYSQSEALTNHATLVSLRTEHLPPATGVTDRRDPVRLPPIVTAPKDFGVASDGAPPPSLGLQTGVTCPASSDRHGARSPKAPPLDQDREFVQSIAPPIGLQAGVTIFCPGSSVRLSASQGLEVPGVRL